MNQRFCGSCGSQLGAQPTPFCTHCGRPVGAAAPSPSLAPSAVTMAIPVDARPSAAPEYVGSGTSPARLRGPGPRRSTLVGAGVVALLVVGGVVASLVLLRGPDGRLLDGQVMPAAVTSEPDEVWTYDAPSDSVGSAVAVGDLTVVGSGEGGELVAVDADGEEVWTVDDRGVGYAAGVPGHGDLLIAAGYEGGGTGVLSADDGTELWWNEDGYPMKVRDDGVLVAEYGEDGNQSRLEWVDFESGDPRWGVEDVEGFDMADSGVFVLRDGDLQRLDPDSGDEDWAVDVDLGEEGYGAVVATDDLVAVQVDVTVTAYDVDNGDVLWTREAQDSETSVSVGAFTSSRVYISESSYDDDDGSSETAITVRDRDGEVGDIEVAPDDFFYGDAFESEGKSFFLSRSDGELYDEDAASVGHYSGDLTPADQGVYALGPDSLRYYEYGESSPAWDLDVPSGDTRQVFAGDGMVLVAIDGEVTAYR